MKKICISIITLVCLTIGSSVAFANSNPIMSSLSNQGFAIQKLDNNALSNITGTAGSLLYGAPYPSTIMGIKTFQLTYLGYGSTWDYRSYRNHGSVHHSQDYAVIYVNGMPYMACGDIFLADILSSPNEWNSANTVTKEQHLQLINAATGQPMPYAYHESTWNRPFGIVRW